MEDDSGKLVFSLPVDPLLQMKCKTDLLDENGKLIASCEKEPLTLEKTGYITVKEKGGIQAATRMKKF